MHLNVGTGIVVSLGNSTTGALGSGQSFVGTIEKIDAFEEITVNLAGAPSNAPGDFYFEFSPDGSHWDVSVWVGGAELSGPSLPPQILRIVLPYFRVRYINGVTPMTELRLTTVYHRVGSMRLSRYLNQSITDTEPVQNVRSVMSFRDVASGSYVNVSSLAPLPITGTIGLNPQAVITASVVAATVTTGSAGLAVGNAPYSPLYVTGSVALNPTPVITANTATTGSAGLAVGNAPYQPLFVSVTSSLPVTFGALPPLNVFNAGTVGVSGTVTLANSQLSVNNFPSVQAVSGVVSLGNWPTTIGVSSSFPMRVFDTGTAAVSGTVQVWTSAPQSVSGTVTSNVTVTGSTGLMVAAPSVAPVWVTGSVGLNPTPVITANTATTGTLGLAVGNAPYQPLWITITSSLPVTGGLVSVVTPTTSSGTPFVLMTTEPTVAHRFDINYDTTSDVNNWYYGYAELGSSDSASVWTIKRISVTAGVATAARWSPSGQVWNDRASVTYT